MSGKSDLDGKMSAQQQWVQVLYLSEKIFLFLKIF